ncbi:hypothetical protein [Bradyrhizobium liaoningense]|uniref:hypothetical protein n=1 Tax=Bradyrhizobium liaoningense TaxID=43992 RepID=UPI001BA8D64A|nr:hypothetical protein [Bradyrhizobium liaoningense]MBR0902641.1 hypothetical protein [Bradyrhizobium liaoningense]
MKAARARPPLCPIVHRVLVVTGGQVLNRFRCAAETLLNLILKDAPVQGRRMSLVTSPRTSSFRLRRVRHGSGSRAGIATNKGSVTAYSGMRAKTQPRAHQRLDPVVAVAAVNGVDLDSLFLEEAIRTAIKSAAGKPRPAKPRVYSDRAEAILREQSRIAFLNRDPNACAVCSAIYV